MPQYTAQMLMCAAGIYACNRGLSFLGASSALPETTARVAGHHDRVAGHHHREHVDEFLDRAVRWQHRAQAARGQHGQRHRPAALALAPRPRGGTGRGGLLSGLQRKTCEPIAIEAGLPRKPIQFFVGSGKWDDEAVMGELRTHVREELAEPEVVVVIDGSALIFCTTASRSIAPTTITAIRSGRYQSR